MVGFSVSCSGAWAGSQIGRSRGPQTPASRNAEEHVCEGEQEATLIIRRDSRPSVGGLKRSLNELSEALSVDRQRGTGAVRG